MMEISGTIAGEFLTFGRACLLGALMAAGYDGIRLLRRIIPHRITGISMEDVLYWLLSGIAVFLLMYRETDGCIRGYIFGGILLGALVYYGIFGRWLVRRLGSAIFRGKKQLKKAWKTVTIGVRKRFKKRSQG
jgi:hypothetical protein